MEGICASKFSFAYHDHQQTIIPTLQTPLFHHSNRTTWRPFGPAPLLQMNQLWNLGPFTRTVSDAALYLDCVSGYHPADPESLPHSRQSFMKILEKIPTGLNIAFSSDLGYAPAQKKVATHVEKAMQSFEEMGQRVEM